MHKGTRYYIRFGGGFTLEKLHIYSTPEALNAGKRQGPIVYAPHECGYAVIIMFSMF